MLEPIQLTLRFLTPAFLGGADQSAEWRAPPIKAQVRHFWRMVQAAKGISDVDELRQHEHRLFGSASGNTGHKSLLRLRLDHWERGALTDWGQRASASVSMGKNSVPAALYLGYGPIAAGSKLKNPPAIEADANAGLRLAVVPHMANSGIDMNAHHQDLLQVIALMHHFGTLGSRSRNGWGSFALEGRELDRIPEKLLVDWQQALHEDWPAGIGADGNKPLIWQSKALFGDWQAAIATLGQIRADTNRAGGDRTLLSYPVTRKQHGGWTGQDRLPASLRFKVVRDGAGKFRARITHFPCRPNDDMTRRGRVSHSDLISTWKRVHAQLDQSPQLHRISLEDLA